MTKRERNMLVVPLPTDPGVQFNPKDIVERTRTMHLVSAVLTGGAALGLALRYRSLFFQPKASHITPPVLPETQQT